MKTPGSIDIAPPRRNSTPTTARLRPLAHRSTDQPINRSTPQRSAFTLIELLVVIAIIVALLAILMPSLNQAMLQAQRTICLSNVHQQHLSQINYAADNFGNFPARALISPDYHRYGANAYNPVTVLRGSYIPETKIIICPLTADLAQQPYEEYRRNDWFAGGYGGWDTTASNIYTAYMWFAGYPNTGLTFHNGTRPFPQRASDLGPDVPLITHRLDFFGGTWSHEITHGGRGLGVAGVLPPNDHQSTDMPLGSADGSGTLHTKAEILPRYTDTIGPGGVYLW